MRLLWTGLLAMGIGCSSGAGNPQGAGPLNEGPSPFENSGQEGPGGPSGQESPGSGGTTTGQGGTGNVGQGGTGNVGQGGSGGGDCLSICNECGGGEQCPTICANATPSQLECANAAPDCAGKQECFFGGTGGSGGGDTGGTGGSTGGCTYPDCGGCTATCDACLCIYQGDTELCASSCG